MGESWKFSKYKKGRVKGATSISEGGGGSTKELKHFSETVASPGSLKFKQKTNKHFHDEGFVLEWLCTTLSSC